MNNECSESTHLNFKGDFYSNPVQKAYYEGGAHFKASELIIKLIELQKGSLQLTLFSESSEEGQSIPLHHCNPPLLKSDKRKLRIEDLPLLKAKPSKPTITIIKLNPMKTIEKQSAYLHRHILSNCPNFEALGNILTDPNAESLTLCKPCKRNHRNLSIKHNIINRNQQKISTLVESSRNMNYFNHLKPTLNHQSKSKRRFPQIIKMPLIKHFTIESKPSYQ